MQRTLLAVALSAGLAALPAYAETPKLIVQITVDQLRADLLTRYAQHFSDQGFNYLLKQGVVFHEAHHEHAITETVVGHATLATGAHPAQHGMVSNLWFDRLQQAPAYNVEDANYPLIGSSAGVDKANEIDPTQKAANSDGRSPANLLGSTFGDELVAHYAGQSRAFAVSVKDRGAITMAGHAGKAFWFSKKNGEFVSSRFYYPDYPSWVSQWNQANPASRYANTDWQLSKPASAYLFGQRDKQSWELALPGFGNTFPHAFGPADSRLFTTLLTLSPVADEFTADFAKTLIDNNKLGQGKAPDYLAISFSATDYVGHVFGPSSLEAEDNLLRLDRTLADLFSHIDQQVGLSNTLIVLSADHGAPEAPGYLKQYGAQARYIDIKGLEAQPPLRALKKRLGISGKLFGNAWQPYLNLDRDAVAQSKLSLAELSQNVVSALNETSGIYRAYSHAELLSGAVPNDAVTRKVQNSFYPQRSGDIYVVFQPNSFVNDFDGLAVASVHGSPWRYDTHVPVIFAGNGLKAANVHRPIATVDVAPTLSAILGINAPSNAAGQALPEVLSQ